jgi:hypothetical protein
VAHLLIIRHTPSPHCRELFEAVVAGANDPEIEGVEVVRRPALTVSPVEMLEADGYLLGSPANLGYISGALKLAFDQSYYYREPCRLHGCRQSQSNCLPRLWTPCSSKPQL